MEDRRKQHGGSGDAECEYWKLLSKLIFHHTFRIKALQEEKRGQCFLKKDARCVVNPDRTSSVSEGQTEPKDEEQRAEVGLLL